MREALAAAWLAAAAAAVAIYAFVWESGWHATVGRT